IYTIEEDGAGFYQLTPYAGQNAYGDYEYPVMMGLPAKEVKVEDPKEPEASFTINKGLATGLVSNVVTDEEGNEDLEQKANSSIRFANDATIFVLAGTKYDVLTGADVNKWSGSHKAAEGSLLLATTSANGFTYVQQGFVNLIGEDTIPGQSAKTDAGYGIVTANAARVYDSNSKTYALSMTIWNGTEEIEVLATQKGGYTNADTKDYVAGTVVAYTDNLNGTISALSALTETNAVTAYDENSGTIKFAAEFDGYTGGEGGKKDEFSITDNTHVVYVDVAGKTGVNAGAISLATPHEDEKGIVDGYYNNVYVGLVKNTEENILYIIVDVTNQIDEDDITPIESEKKPEEKPETKELTVTIAAGEPSSGEITLTATAKYGDDTLSSGVTYSWATSDSSDTSFTDSEAATQTVPEVTDENSVTYTVTVEYTPEGGEKITKTATHTVEKAADAG
ncbi:MAG: hypothetical protein K2F83_01155, partial [Oscillospiraceae bacterium]|nr:hypothetical protein [Oscillospiraceae bacterium]